VLTGAGVTSIHETRDAVTVVAGGQVHRARRLVVCGGLQADRLLRLAGVEPDFRVVPFRGEYHRLAPQRAGHVRHLVYPVPDPRLPFLGVHVTPGVDGSVTVGPNAVPGLAREGYRKGQVVWRDAVDALGYPGTWRLARRHWRSGLAEARNSLSRRGYLAAVRRYWPDLTVEDLLPHEAGIRAQAVRRDGTLVDDFLLRRTGRSLHVCNAPSPAATSALPIADLVVQRLLAD
jgi:L-2-hydroxyglutarate oxidase